MIDFRSDTLTLPSKEMVNAMFKAHVGDDVFDEDPTVKQLEKYAATLFNKEAGLFLPSGTMANQVAIKMHTNPLNEVICDSLSHIYYYEGGGVAFHSGASLRLVPTQKGILSSEDILANINPDNIHQPITTLVVVENTHNKAGGICYDLKQLQDLKATCESNKLKLHMDGARIFNAIIAKGYSAIDVGNAVDSITICLSKGLGAPIGTLLLATQEDIVKAKRIRKVMGGAMRQIGFMAAAGLFALENNIDRIAIDHKHAKAVAAIFRRHPVIQKVVEPETNIVFLELKEQFSPKDFCASLAARQIMAFPFGKNIVRLVTHMHITREQVDLLPSILDQLKITTVN